MKPNLIDLDALIKAAQELKMAHVSFEKKSLKAREVDMSMSPRAIGKAEADMHWDALHVERSWDTLHARAVDLGLCEPKPEGDYRAREIKWARMHGQVYQPAMPRCIAARQTTTQGADHEQQWARARDRFDGGHLIPASDQYFAARYQELDTRDRRNVYEAAYKRAWADARRAQARAEPEEMSPDFTDTARAALLWVLWHHQGGSSPVGQPIRFALGMGQHDHLNAHQLAEARRWQNSHPVNPSVYPSGQVPGPIPEPVATLHDDGYYTFKRGQEPQGARYAGWRMDVYAAPPQAPSDYVLQLLVAAGHVTQAKVDEARAIATDLGITDTKAAIAVGAVRFDIPAEDCIKFHRGLYPIYECIECKASNYLRDSIPHKPGCRVAAALTTNPKGA